MPLFNVSKEEWLIANTELSKKLPGTKLRKKLSGLAHSFIKFKDKIIAIGKKIGAGSYGVVKQGIDELENSYAIKTQGGAINEDDREEETIGEEMNFAYDMVERTLDQPKTFYANTHHKTTSHIKKYSLLKYLEGSDLVYEIYDKNAYHNDDRLVRINKLTPVQRLIIAIQVCQLLKQLQQHRVIHADLKPENLKIIINGNNICVYLMDFGFSMHLPPDKTFITSIAKGSPGYIAPEIFNTAFPGLSELKFSFESDVYAIGVLFSEDLELESRLFEEMIKIDPLQREKVDLTMARLLGALEASNNLDKDALNFIMSIKKQNVTIAKPVQKLGYINPDQMKDVSLKPATRPNKPAATVLPNPANEITLRPTPKHAKVEAVAAPVPVNQGTLRPMQKRQEVNRTQPRGDQNKVLPLLVDQNKAQRLIPNPKTAVQPAIATAQAASPSPMHIRAAQGAQPNQAATMRQQVAPKTNLPQKGKMPPPYRMLPTDEVKLRTPIPEINSKPFEKMPTKQTEKPQQTVGAQVAPSMRKRMVVVLPGQQTDHVGRAKANLLMAFENHAQKQDGFVPKGAVITPFSKAIKVK